MALVHNVGKKTRIYKRHSTVVIFPAQIPLVQFYCGLLWICWVVQEITVEACMGTEITPIPTRRRRCYIRPGLTPSTFISIPTHPRKTSIKTNPQ